MQKGNDFRFERFRRILFDESSKSDLLQQGNFLFFEVGIKRRRETALSQFICSFREGAQWRTRRQDQ